MKLTEYELGELLIYEQPTAYIVNSTEYSDSYKTPVLTAGKSFILGYTNETDNIFGKLPVILFDDFTTATQFVNFKFKVKSSAMKILNVNTELVNPKYIFYRMQTIQFDHSTHKRYWIQQYSKLKVQIPPIVEQERIVAKIEELFSDLDNAVETLKATKAQLKLYKQAVLKSAFSRCIELKKAEDLCFFITKGTTPKKAEFQLEDKSIPFIKVYNLTFDGSLDFTIEPTFIAKSIHETSLARSIVYPGDVLMNIVGPPMGKVSIVPSSYDEWNINQAIARFRCKEELNNRYLAYFLMSSETVEKMSKQTKATAGQFNLTLETCRNIDIPVCSINEQLKIVDNLDTQLTAYNNIEKTVNDALQQATSMRQSILKQAFEGRL